MSDIIIQNFDFITVCYNFTVWFFIGAFLNDCSTSPNVSTCISKMYPKRNNSGVFAPV
jgi:hypothetical protein